MLSTTPVSLSWKGCVVNCHRDPTLCRWGLDIGGCLTLYISCSHQGSIASFSHRSLPPQCGGPHMDSALILLWWMAISIIDHSYIVPNSRASVMGIVIYQMHHFQLLIDWSFGCRFCTWSWSCIVGRGWLKLSHDSSWTLVLNHGVTAEVRNKSLLVVC